LSESSQSSGVASEGNRYCGRCGFSVQPDLSYCPRCGFALTSTAAYPPNQPTIPSTSSRPLDWREQRRQWRAQRRAERYSRSHFGAIIIASILIVAGLAIFFPALPWQFFWGSLLILAGVWIVYLWSTRSARYAPKENQESQ
jgi:Flp pilus assembly protein TadB